jgi:hypothetical protein
MPVANINVRAEQIACRLWAAPTRQSIKMLTAELQKFSDNAVPTTDAYDAACKALAHWRNEAKRLGRLAGITPREMKR